MLAFLFLAFHFLSFPPQCRTKSPRRWDNEGSRGGRSEVVGKRRRRRRRGRGEQGRRERSEGSLERASRPQPQEPIQKAKKALEGKTKSGAKTGAKAWDVALRCRRGHRAVPSVVDSRALAAATERPCRTAPPPSKFCSGTLSNCPHPPRNALKLSARSPERPPIVCPHNQCCTVI